MITTDWCEGLVGNLVQANLENRLRTFIVDAESEPLALFTQESRSVSDTGDWYGEHLGKWMVATAHACLRTKDPALAEQLCRVVQSTVACQEPNGYLGTYSDSAPARFTHFNAANVRTWDLWVHAWMMLGLVAASDVPGVKGALEAVTRIARLLSEVFPATHDSPLKLGNHLGLSSSILIEPLVLLHKKTADQPSLDLAQRIYDELQLHKFQDVAEIGTGKIYQLLWTFVGCVHLYDATGDASILTTIERLWANVRDDHLNPLGGPWGGIATHKEVFNPRGYFSPYGLVETCSTATWLSLSLLLFKATSKAQYVAEFERALLNGLIGSVGKGADDWSYFTSPNGRRVATYHWACCRSSGALGLEMASDMVVTESDGGVSINLYLPSRTTLRNAEIIQSGELPSGESEIRITSAAPLSVKLRIPEWAGGFSVALNGETVSISEGQILIERIWEGTDILKLTCEPEIKLHQKVETLDHHGQEIVHNDYACVSRGPFVYATGLIDGYKRTETLRLANLTPTAGFRAAADGGIDLHIPSRRPIHFLPFYQVEGWRTTWLEVAWQ